MKQAESDTPPHRIERTRNRSSRALLKDDVIVIRLARGLTTREEREHIEILLKRMAKSVARERRKHTIDPFRSILEGAAEHTVDPPMGDQCHFSMAPGARTHAWRVAGGWKVHIGVHTDRAVLHRFLWRLISLSARKHVTGLTQGINADTLRVPISAVRLRYASTQWGSCSSAGNISLNPALLFLPPHLLRYVIIHELAHRRHRGHTKAFWNTVERACPDAREARKALRNYRLIPL